MWNCPWRGIYRPSPIACGLYQDFYKLQGAWIVLRLGYARALTHEWTKSQIGRLQDFNTVLGESMSWSPAFVVAWAFTVAQATQLCYYKSDDWLLVLDECLLWSWSMYVSFILIMVHFKMRWLVPEEGMLGSSLWHIGILPIPVFCRRCGMFSDEVTASLALLTSEHCLESCTSLGL